jgi:subtilisin family serine protease
MRRLLAALTLAGVAACDNAADPVTPTAEARQLLSDTATVDDRIIPGHYIVSVEDAVDPVSLAAAYGIAPRHVYRHLVTGFAAEIPSLVLDALRLDARVRLIEPDAQVWIDGETTTQSMKSGEGPYVWGLDRIDQRAGGAAQLDSTYSYKRTGGGVRVYVIDTGIRFDHVEFGGRAVPGFDAFDDGQNGNDCHGHGTHVAGTVGGSTYGVAKEASLVAVRVLSCAGSGSQSGIIAGMEWIAEHGKLPAVASMSIGSGIPSRSETYENAVRTLFDAGVLLVMSAGNGWSAAGVGTGVGYDSCLRSPSAIKVGITVGATDRTDAKTMFSNYGDCVDIFAPGSGIPSAWATGPTATRTASGTSMATPHVSGVAALFLQQARGATAQQVKDAVVEQATRNVVTQSLSQSNHMVYSRVEAPSELRGSRPKSEAPCTPKRQRDGQC